MGKDNRKPLTRQKILEAAARQFARRGFRDTSIDIIARHASVSHGTVFWHFGSKTQLYAEIVQTTGDRFLTVMRRQAEDDSASLAQMIARWLAAIESDSTAPGFFSWLIRERQHPDVAGPAQTLNARFIKFWLEWLCELDARHASRPIRRKADLARLILATISGLLATDFEDTGVATSALLVDFAEAIEGTSARGDTH